MEKFTGTAPVSAMAGTPPANDLDLAIVKGLNQMSLAALRIKHLVDNNKPMPKLDPSKGIKRPPFRPPPDQYHFETRGPRIIASASVAIAVMVLITGTRIMIRARNVKLYFGKDDWAIIAGTVLAISVPAINIAQVHYAGLGKHTYDCTYYEWYTYQKLMPTQYLLLFEALSMVKISIVLLYMRLSNFASLKWKIINWTILFILISHMIASFFVHLFMCKPAGVFWNLVRIGELSSPPVCQDQSKSYAILNSFHILTDFSLFAVPVAMLWKVQMHWAKKLQICIAGLVGLTSCAFAIMRTISSYRVVLSQPMWSPFYIIIWAHVDLTTAVIAASLPVLSFLLTRLSRFFRSRFSPSNSRNDPFTEAIQGAKKTWRRPKGHPLSLPTDLREEHEGDITKDSESQDSSETAHTDEAVATARHHAEKKCQKSAAP